MTKLAEISTTCCSCYGQYPERRYVDFEAAFDGPVLEGSVKVAIDDLVICEDCLAEAARLLNYVRDDLSAGLIAELQEQLIEANHKAAVAEQKVVEIGKLFDRPKQESVAATLEPEKPKRGPGRPRKQPEPVAGA